MKRSVHRGGRCFGVGRSVSTATLAQYIVNSIRQHAAEGRVRTVEQYTMDGETQQMVAALLQQTA